LKLKIVGVTVGVAYSRSKL